MAHENSVSFKCYLQGEGVNEVRRFGVDKDVVCNFNYLKGKLQTVFPSLQGKDILVAWIDSDGDQVIISSDDELMIALTEQQTDVRKLYVTIKPGSTQNEEGNNEGNRNQHFGVACDGCDKGVEGFRYKCIQCPDFDLCATCEGKGLHAQHYMIRMPVPTSWRPHFGKRLAHHLNKAANKAGAMDGEGHCPFNPRGDGKFEYRGGHGHHGGKHHRGRHHVGWLGTLASYLNEWSLPDDITGNNEEAGPSCSDKEQKNTQKEDAHVQYLKDIGKTVASLLDPLGIDVDVEVRTRDKEDNASKTENGKKNGGDNATEEQGSAMDVDEKQDKDKDSQQQQSERDLSPESEGWTVLSPQQGEQNAQQQSEVTTTTAAAAATSSQSIVTNVQAAATTTSSSMETGAVPKMPVGTSGNGIYPALNPPFFTTPTLISSAPMQPPFTPIAAFPPPVGFSGLPVPPAQLPFFNSTRQPPVPVSIPSAMVQTPTVRPHVAEAVAKMMSMGFSNEGGWLTQLLDSKDGDIIKALDVLQPVKRS